MKNFRVKHLVALPTQPVGDIQELPRVIQELIDSTQRVKYHEFGDQWYSFYRKAGRVPRGLTSEQFTLNYRLSS